MEEEGIIGGAAVGAFDVADGDQVIAAVEKAVEAAGDGGNDALEPGSGGPGNEFKSGWCGAFPLTGEVDGECLLIAAQNVD